jgi:hypothetical protein
MKFAARLAAVGAGAVLLLGGAIVASGDAHASVGPAAWTAKGSGTAMPNSASGWRAESSDYYMTHAESYIGGDGNSTIGRLPVVAAPATNVTGAPLSNATGGVGIALCSSTTGISAQVGVVNLGNGFEDIIAGSGRFKSSATHNSDNDPCFDGLADDSTVSTPFAPAEVLIPNVPIDTTVQLEVEYDPHVTTFLHGGFLAIASLIHGHIPVGTVQREIKFGSAGAVNFNEADYGTVADTSTSVALNGFTAPAVNADGPEFLVRFAHMSLTANPLSGHGSVTSGSLSGSPKEIQDIPQWGMTPVASTLNAQPAAGNGSNLFLVPTDIVEDNTIIDQGALAA